MQATVMLRKMILSKTLTQTVMKALRSRLQAILDEREKQYAFWEENVKDKLHPTRQREVRRKFERIIQALKVIIHDLTPFMERTEDQPSLIKRKNKTK